MPFINLPTILQSKAIFCNDANITGCTVKVYFTGGSLRMFLGLSNAEGTDPTSWEEVTVTSGTETEFEFSSSTGTFLFYQVVKDYDTIISTQLNSNGERTAPGLSIYSFVTD